MTQVTFALWMQAQYLWLSQMRGAHALRSVLGALPEVLLHQGQHLCLGLLLASLWALGRGRLRAQRAVLIAASLLLLLQVLDQLFYALFFDHLQFHFAEEAASTDLSAFWGSFKAVLGGSFFLNLALWAALSVWIWRRFAKGSGATASPDLSARSLLWATALLSAYFLAGVRTGENSARIENHPLLTLLKSLGTDGPKTPGALGSGGDLDALRWGKPSFSGGTEKAILDYAQGRGQGKRPNLILFTWESVGAVDLFPQGALDPAMTPNLAAWAPQTVLFPSVTTGFPGTVRSHSLLNTGGHCITWGTEETLFPQAWTGPGLGRQLKENAYSTGLFAASYFFLASYKGLYDRQGWDRTFRPDDQPAAYQAKVKLNSWGIDDGQALAEARRWMAAQPKDKPFFAQFLTSATHHPYSIPNGFPRRFSQAGEAGDLNAYKDSVRFLDSLLGDLVADLKAQGRLQDTVIAIVGDHGEAFGLQHKTNLLHKHQVYEENIRSYLLLLDFSVKDGPLRSSKDAWMGDVMPSLLHLAKVKVPAKVLGQDLFDSGYQARIRYFHKNAHPEKWGLKDGAWKFIAQKNGDREAELYDLSADPTEQKNLADQYPDRVEAYFQLCAGWYLKANRDYTSLLKVPPKETDDASSALGGVGPHLLQVGYRDASAQFHPLTQVNPLQRLSAYTQGDAYPQETTLIYEWLSPSGYRERVGLPHPAGAAETWLDYQPDQALEPGPWELRVFQGQRLLLRGNFSVSEQAALLGAPREIQGGKLEALLFGQPRRDGSVQQAPFFHPAEKISAVLMGQPWAQDKVLTFEWIAPSGKARRFDFRYGKGWKGAWVASGQQGALEEGAWNVNVYDRDKVLISGSFEVSARAPRLRP